VNSTRLTILESNVPLQPPEDFNWTETYKDYNWIKEFRSCEKSHYPVVRMECHDYRKYHIGTSSAAIIFHGSAVLCPLTVRPVAVSKTATDTLNVI